MRLSSYTLATFAILAYTAHCSFWSDILNGLRNTNRFNKIIGYLDNSTSVLDDDDATAVFVCEIVQGDIGDALGAVPSVIIDQAEDEIAALTSFVGSLPSLVPDLFNEIVSGGEVVVSIVEEIVTAPGEALTVIENGVEKVWATFTAEVGSIIDDITHFVGCDILNNCPTFTDNGILARCSSVLNNFSATVGQPSATPTLPGSSWTATAVPASGSSTLASQTTAVVTSTSTVVYATGSYSGYSPTFTSVVTAGGAHSTTKLGWYLSGIAAVIAVML